MVGKEARHPGRARSPRAQYLVIPRNSEDSRKPLTGSEQETDIV